MDVISGELIDMDGQPMTLQQWADLYEDLAGRTLGHHRFETPTGTVEIRTAWIGTPKSCWDDEPETFGTGIKDGEGWSTARYYATRQAAQHGHSEIVNSYLGPYFRHAVI